MDEQASLQDGSVEDEAEVQTADQANPPAGVQGEQQESSAELLGSSGGTLGSSVEEGNGTRQEHGIRS